MYVVVQCSVSQKKEIREKEKGSEGGDYEITEFELEREL